MARWNLSAQKRDVWAPAVAAQSLLQFARRMRFGEGVHAGELYRPDQHAPQYCLLRAIESRKYTEFKVLKPIQDGGTWAGQIIPMLWVLFECRDPCIFAAPNAPLLGKLWRQKVLPTIKKSRWKNRLPKKGQGSRGGAPDEIMFDGVPLSFLTAGASDEASTSGISARFVGTDEYDSMDPNKRMQIKGRAGSFEASGEAIKVDCSTLKQVFGESLLEEEYRTISVRGRCMYQCPYTGIYRHLDWDEHVRYDASSRAAAMRTVRLVFEDGGLLGDGEIIEWTESDRRSALKNWKEVFHGQMVMHCIDADGTVLDARVIGTALDTDVYGIRWESLDSPLKNMCVLAGREQACLALAEQGQEAAIEQFTRDEKTKHYQKKYIDAGGIVPAMIAERVIHHDRRVVPPDTLGITIGLDPGGSRTGLHWVAKAWRPHRRRHIIDYGRFMPTVTSEAGVLEALIQWWIDILAPGWGGHRVSCVFIDSSWLPNAVQMFCRRVGYSRCKPIQGYSQTHHKFKEYRPKLRGATADVVRHDRHRPQPTWHELRQHRGGRRIDIDADFWKQQVQDSLRLPIGHPGSQTLFLAPVAQHLEGVDIPGARGVPGYAVQVCGERREYDAAKHLHRWVTAKEITQEVHYLDADAYADAAGDYMGYLAADVAPRRSAPQEPSLDSSVFASVYGATFSTDPYR